MSWSPALFRTPTTFLSLIRSPPKALLIMSSPFFYWKISISSSSSSSPFSNSIWSIFSLINFLSNSASIFSSSASGYFISFSFYIPEFLITAALFPFDDDWSKCFKPQNIHTITLINNKANKYWINSQ